MQDLFELKQEIDDKVFEIIRKVRASNCGFPTYDYEWGPWIDWDGSCEYGPSGLEENDVNLYRRSPNSDWYLVQEAHHVCGWKWDGGPNDILAYRIRKYSE